MLLFYNQVIPPSSITILHSFKGNPHAQPGFARLEFYKSIQFVVVLMNIKHKSDKIVY